MCWSSEYFFVDLWNFIWTDSKWNKSKMCILRPTFAHLLVVCNTYKSFIIIIFMCFECTYTSRLLWVHKKKFIIEQKCIYLQLNLFAYKKKNNATAIHVYIPRVLIIEINNSLNASARIITKKWVCNKRKTVLNYRWLILL